MKLKLALIGCGLTGTAILYQLILRLEQPRKKGCLALSCLSISLIEKSSEFGPGFPHSSTQALPVHLLNQPAASMSIRGDDPDDFVKWITANFGRLKPRLSFARRHFPGVSFKPSRKAYYPRFVMGEYLKERFEEAVATGYRLGIDVGLYGQQEAVNIETAAPGYRIRLKHTVTKKESAINADVVVLSTGHWSPAGPGSDSGGSRLKGYFGSPWPAEDILPAIPVGETVGIIGTGLTAIDAVLTLTSGGGFRMKQNAELEYVGRGPQRRIVMYSRGGRLPKVRGKIGPYRNRYLTMQNIERIRNTQGGRLALKDVFSLLEKDLECAGSQSIRWAKVLAPPEQAAVSIEKDIQSACHGDGPHGELVWQTVLHQSFPFVRDLYLYLMPAERKRFDQEYRSLFLSYAAPMPVINARKLLALLKAGIIDVVRLGTDYRMGFDSKTGVHELSYRNGAGFLQTDRFHYLLDGRGQNINFETSPSVLAHRLLDSGLAQIETLTYSGDEDIRSSGVLRGKNKAYNARQRYMDEKATLYKTGSILIDPDTHLVIPAVDGRNGAWQGSLYAVGVMTGGQIIDVSNASSDVFSAIRVIDHFMAKRFSGCGSYKNGE